MVFRCLAGCGKTTSFLSVFSTILMFICVRRCAPQNTQYGREMGLCEWNYRDDRCIDGDNAKKLIHPTL
jgi:hypothetical protein